ACHFCGSARRPRPLPALPTRRSSDLERYVGVQGGGMDQAISLGARAGTAARVSFDPLRLEYVRVPSDWRVVVASSLVSAKKSGRSEEHTSELQSRENLVCRLLLDKKK